MKVIDIVTIVDRVIRGRYECDAALLIVLAAAAMMWEHISRVCCVERIDRSHGYGASVVSETTREIAERDMDPIMNGHVDGEFVVAAA